MHTIRQLAMLGALAVGLGIGSAEALPAAKPVAEAASSAAPVAEGLVQRATYGYYRPKWYGYKPYYGWYGYRWHWPRWYGHYPRYGYRFGPYRPHGWY